MRLDAPVLADPGVEQRAVSQRIDRRAAEKGAGDFKEGTYNFARKFINFGFSRVFNATPCLRIRIFPR